MILKPKTFMKCDGYLIVSEEMAAMLALLSQTLLHLLF